MTRFRTDADAAAERAVAAELEAAWAGVTVHAFPPLTAIDWYAERGGAIWAYLEVKCRKQTVDHWETVYLAVRKWLALWLCEWEQGVPGVYVVRFADALRWIRVTDVDATKPELAGDFRNGGRPGRNGVEPMLLVPVAAMHEVRLP